MALARQFVRFAVVGAIATAVHAAVFAVLVESGPIDPVVATVVAAVAGLCIGSFLNVVIHRLPKMLERGWEAQCAELRGER